MPAKVDRRRGARRTAAVPEEVPATGEEELMENQAGGTRSKPKACKRLQFIAHANSDISIFPGGYPLEGGLFGTGNEAARPLAGSEAPAPNINQFPQRARSGASGLSLADGAQLAQNQGQLASSTAALYQEMFQMRCSKFLMETMADAKAAVAVVSSAFDSLTLAKCRQYANGPKAVAELCAFHLHLVRKIEDHPDFPVDSDGERSLEFEKLLDEVKTSAEKMSAMANLLLSMWQVAQSCAQGEQPAYMVALAYFNSLKRQADTGSLSPEDALEINQLQMQLAMGKNPGAQARKVADDAVRSRSSGSQGAGTKEALRQLLQEELMGVFRDDTRQHSRGRSHASPPRGRDRDRRRSRSRDRGSERDWRNQGNYGGSRGGSGYYEGKPRGYNRQ